MEFTETTPETVELSETERAEQRRQADEWRRKDHAVRDAMGELDHIHRKFKEHFSWVWQVVHSEPALNQGAQNATLILMGDEFRPAERDLADAYRLVVDSNGFDMDAAVLSLREAKESLVAFLGGQKLLDVIDECAALVTEGSESSRILAWARAGLSELLLHAQQAFLTIDATLP